MIEKELFTYKTEKINFTEAINSKLNFSLKITANDDYIHSVFESSFYTPNDLNVAELDEFLDKNQDNIDGILTYYINDENFIEINIVNGKSKEMSLKNSIKLKSDYPCSYDGIQDCVQDVIYEEWTTYTKLKCAITGGLNCIIDEAINCIEKNCFD
ncbi:MAG: hypothetical protein KIH80_003185 [Flavobacteriia bacterium]|nr:hypothetical protein [Flavobacteriia bacterium]